MKRVLILLLIVVVFVMTIAGCVDITRPIYEKTNEDGMSVYIDGVRYKQLPWLRWRVSTPQIWEAEVIGYAGDWDTKLTEAYGDTERNFVNVWINGHYECPLYRADIVIPEPSAQSVDELAWNDYAAGSDEIYSNITVDKSIIEELFQMLDTGERTTKFEMIEKDDVTIFIFINCMSSDLPAASYTLRVGKSNGKIVCGNGGEKEYVEIPVELLEKIAGKSLKGVVY